jgi:hypothetical protein
VTSAGPRLHEWSKRARENQDFVLTITNSSSQLTKNCKMQTDQVMDTVRRQNPKAPKQHIAVDRESQTKIDSEIVSRQIPERENANHIQAVVDLIVSTSLLRSSQSEIGRVPKHPNLKFP